MRWGGFRGSSDWAFHSGNPGELGVFHCVRPSAPTPHAPPRPRYSRSPGRGHPSPPAPPIAHGRRQSARLSSDPFSPGEERRRPAFPLSIFYCCSSRNCCRCHLKTPLFGGGRGRGEGKKTGKCVWRLRKNRRVPSDRKSGAPPTTTRKLLPGTCFLCGLPLQVCSFVV